MTQHRIDTLKNTFVDRYKQDEIRGNVRLCCESLSLPRSTYYKWLKEDAEFRQKIHDADLDMCDDMESVLVSRAVDKSDTALIYWLKYNHPKYHEEPSQLIQINSGDMKVNFTDGRNIESVAVDSSNGQTQV